MSSRETALTLLARLPLLLLILLSSPASAGPVIEMELQAGLAGQAVIALPTEIKIRLFSTSTVEGELEIMDGTGRTSVPIQLDELTQKTLWLAVTPKPSRAIEVRLLINRATVISKELAFNMSRAPLIIVSTTIPMDETLGRHQPSLDIMPLILSAKGLPHSPSAYAGIDALITDSQTLSSLSQEQYRALADYLGRCNILLLSSATPSLLQRLQNLSGCQGRFIHNYDSLAQLPPLLHRLHAKRPAKPPAAQELMSLHPDIFQRQMLSSLTLYLGGYLLIISLASWRMQNMHYLLLLPVFTAGAGTLAWSGSGSHRLISWVEMESGDSHTRVTSLLLLGGDRQGESSVTVDAETRLSSLNPDSRQPDIRYQQQDGQRVLHVHTRLLSPQSYYLTSTLRQSSPFSLSFRDGVPRVMFHAEGSSDETTLLWRGNSYSVPALTKERPWQPDEARGQPPASAAEQLLNRRLSLGAAALLLPFTAYPSDTETDSLQTSGWLVIRQDREQRL